MQDDGSHPVPKWLERLAFATVALVPFAAACARSPIGAEWRDDLPLLRGAGLALSPMSGLPSTILLALAGLLPLGTHELRGALLFALSLSALSLILLAFGRRALLAISPSPRLALGLATLGALTAALSPVLQREATVAGGATLGALLAIVPLLCLSGARTDDSSRVALAGLAIGLAATESFAAGLAAIVLATVAILVAGFSASAVDRANAHRRTLLVIACAAIGSFALASIPVFLAARASTGWATAATSLRVRELVALDVTSLRARGASAWLSDIGFLGCALSIAGLAAGLLRAKARFLVFPLLALLLLDLLAPPRNAGVLSNDPLAVLRVLAVSSAAILAAMGVHAAVTTLLVSRLAFARAASALLIAFDATLVALAHEEAAASADRSEHAGATTFTDLALLRLPPFAVVLARTDALAWRLWSARLATGARPDVTLVPLPLLTRGDLATRLLEEEPSLTGLLRDLSMTGLPSEYALSSVADVRPLYLELDSRWEKRLATHMVAEKLWLRYAPEPLGASDRRLSQAEDLRAALAVIQVAKTDDVDDEATLEVIAEHARQSVIASSLVSDHEAIDRSVGLLAAAGREPKTTDSIWSWVVPPKPIDARSGAHGRKR